MQLEKQTYLNTENLSELYERKEQVFASYPSDRYYGGVRFVLKRRANVVLTAACEDPASPMALTFDGRLLAKSTARCFRAEIRAEKGEHLFEMVSPYSHGGFYLSAESVGLEKGRLYSDRVGGYSEGTANHLFLCHGDRILEKATVSGGNLTLTSLSGILRDAALLYDKTNESYGSDIATVSASGATALTVDTGVSQTLSVSGLKSAAICDGMDLPVGVDYLVGYVTSGGLFVGAAAADRAITAEDFSSPITEIIRVVSAQRGSVLLTENAEGVWKGMYFHACGDKSIVCGTHSIPYYEVPLTRNRIVAPCAHIEGVNRRPAFYYRTEEGAMMRLLYGGTPTRQGYVQAYCPGGSFNLSMSLQDGEPTISAV